MPISVCILANKWRPVLIKTLAAYANCCSEILLGINGDFNPESYPELYQASKLKIIPLEWKGYGTTKNELASKAENDWILSVDTDEVADLQLQQSLATLSLNQENIIYALGMCHYFGNTPIKHGAWETGKRNFLRLYNRRHTEWDNVEVHESIRIQPNSQIVRLPGQINHYTVDTFGEFLEKNKYYALLSVEKYRQQGKKSFFGRSWLSAGFTFLNSFFIKLGFLDGKAGWQVAKGLMLYTYWKYHYLHTELKKGKS